jgi:flagellar biosynthesis/type III secretory pathway ATPase
MSILIGSKVIALLGERGVEFLDFLIRHNGIKNNALVIFSRREQSDKNSQTVARAAA